MRAHLVPAALFVAITIALTWPLVLHLPDRVPHDLADPLLTIWTLWWNATVLPFTERWWDGMAFFPAPDTLTLSDHRVGIGIITSPLIWLGASPLTAHNVAFLASFVLCAIAAYAVCYTLTNDRGAACIGGLVFGFNPFRAEHLPHLELLASYWLPVVFLALHRWVEAPSWRWAAALSLAMLMQALTSGYYFVFSVVLIGLWLLWFRPRSANLLRAYTQLGGALFVPVLLIAPVLMKYGEAHAAMSLARSINEIEQLSADVIGLLTAPRLIWFWNAPLAWRTPEGAIFPGLTAVAVVVIALVISTTSTSPGSVLLRRLRAGLLTLAGLAGAVSLIPVLGGPVAFNLGGVPISVSGAYKPFSLFVLFSIGWLLTSPQVRASWRAESALTFYALATVAMWAFAFGPTARVFGERVIYKAPYSWLMLLPSIRDEFRAPARFAMLAALTLSIAAAVAVGRLLRERTPAMRRSIVTALAVAVMLDSWISPFPLHAPPPRLMISSEVPQSAAVLELPMGVFENAAAMYHSTQHGRPTLNGLSGYEPPHFQPMVVSIEEGRLEVLRELARHRPIAVFIRRDAAADHTLADLVRKAGARHVSSDDTYDVALIPQIDATPLERPRGPTRYPQRLAVQPNQGDTALMMDDDELTGWSNGLPQAGAEEIVADLGAVLPIDGVELMTRFTYFPRVLAIDVRQSETDAWQEVWRGDDIASRSVAALLERPPRINLFFGFRSQTARFVRLRQLGATKDEWLVLEIKVQVADG